MKSLENDFLRFSTKEKEQLKKPSFWILDALLSEFYEKKTTGESLNSSFEFFIENFSKFYFNRYKG
mgnify:CR=1 FL=1